MDDVLRLLVGVEIRPGYKGLLRERQVGNILDFVVAPACLQYGFFELVFGGNKPTLKDHFSGAFVHTQQVGFNPAIEWAVFAGRVHEEQAFSFPDCLADKLDGCSGV